MYLRAIAVLVILAGCGSGEQATGVRPAAAAPCPGLSSLQAPARPSSALTEQQGQEQQGQEQQGCQGQGTSLIGDPTDTPIISSYSGWFDHHPLRPARIVRGQLLADGGSGKDIVGTFIPSSEGSQAVLLVVTSAAPDPTYPDGSTWLYGLNVVDPQTGLQTPFCAPDANGVAAAIPIAAVFDGSGARIESTSQFTFGCTSGVMAKCIRWGYRPWLTDASGSSAKLAALHWACTRMARADYCGDGRSWTQNGTTINIWDTSPAPGPFQTHGPYDPTFIFEAGWNTHGAVCLSKERWLTLDPRLAQACPDRLIAPGVSTPLATVCESPLDALTFNNSVQLFDESRINVKTQ